MAAAAAGGMEVDQENLLPNVAGPDSTRVFKKRRVVELVAHPRMTEEEKPLALRTVKYAEMYGRPVIIVIYYVCNYSCFHPAIPDMIKLPSKSSLPRQNYRLKSATRLGASCHFGCSGVAQIV